MPDSDLTRRAREVLPKLRFGSLFLISHGAAYLKRNGGAYFPAAEWATTTQGHGLIEPISVASQAWWRFTEIGLEVSRLIAEEREDEAPQPDTDLTCYARRVADVLPTAAMIALELACGTSPERARYSRSTTPSTVIDLYRLSLVDVTADPTDLGREVVRVLKERETP